MEITIFKEVTTEGVITSIEENSKKYHEGLYCNMNNLPERTMVKKGASEIGDIIKEVKASGVKLRKSKIAEVNKEEKLIIERLEAANLPFTDLLDAYNAERKVILDAEKARKQSILDTAQYENDHEMGILINKTFEYDREQELKAEADIEAKRVAEREEYAAKQVKLAEQRQLDNQLQDEANKRYEENKRLADVNNVRAINRSIFTSFTDAGLDKESAKIATQALIDNKVSHTKISY